MSDFVREPRPDRRGALLLYMIAAVGLPLSSALFSLLEPHISNLSVGIQLMIMDLIYYLPFMALPIALYIKRVPGRYNTCRTETVSPLRILVIILLAANVFLLCDDLTVLWAIPLQKIGLNVYAGTIASARNSRELVMLVLSGAALPAICEEFLFRGVMLTAFEDMGTKRAILFSSLMFALLHASLLGLPAEFITGMIICCITITSGSLYAGMIFHTLYNSIVLVVDYFQQGGTGGDLLEKIGGISGLLILLLDVLLFWACISMLLRIMFARAFANNVKMTAPSDPKRLTVPEYICLAISAAAIIFLYAVNFSSML